MTLTCPVCGGTLHDLGTLGRLAWFRCRNCGAELNEPVDDFCDIAECYDDLNDRGEES